MSLTHPDLINLAKILGHTSCGNGICRGFSMMLSQAVLIQEEEIFFTRLKLIEQYKNKENGFQQLKEDIDEIKKKQSINEEEKKLLDIQMLFDGIMLSQSPTYYKSIFGKNIPQQNIEEIYSLISSIKLDNSKIPVSIISNKNYAFERQELNAYLTDLEQILKKNDSIIPILLGSNRHCVFVNYDKKKKKWMYVDTNLLKASNSYYFELSSKELTNAILTSFECNEHSPVIFNATAISNSKTKTNDRQIFQSLNPKYTKISLKYASRYDKNKEGLLCKACTSGDLDTVKELLQLQEIDVNKSNDDELNPLSIACLYRYAAVVNALLQHPKIEVNHVVMEFTPLTIACHNKDIEIVKTLLQHPKIEVNPVVKGGTPLIMACHNKDIEIVKALVQHPKIKVNQAEHSFIRQIFIPKNNELINDLYSKFNDFMELAKANPSLAHDLFEQNKDNVVRLVTTFNVFLQLHQANSSLANDLFKHNHDKITSLFTTPESLQKLKETDFSIYQIVTKTQTIPTDDECQNQIVDASAQVLPTPPTPAPIPSSSAPNIGMQILGGFISVIGCAAVAIGVTVLNAATLGIAGLVEASLGTAAILGGIGLFAYNTFKNRPHRKLAFEDELQRETECTPKYMRIRALYRRSKSPRQ